MDKIRELIKLALAEEAPADEETTKVASEENETQEDLEMSLEKIADLLDVVRAGIEQEVEMGKEAAGEKLISEGLKKALPYLFGAGGLALAGGAGAGGYFLGKARHKGQAEKQMYDIAKQYYGLGAQNAATYIKDLLLRQYYEPPVGVPETLEKASAYLRKTAEVIKNSKHREEALKVAQLMLEKGLIDSDSLVEKVAELEQEEDLEVVKKAIELDSLGVNFGKVAEDISSSQSDGIYNVL